MKGTICRIDDRQLKLGTVCRLKKLGPVPISGLRALLLCSCLLHYTGFQPLPPLSPCQKAVWEVIIWKKVDRLMPEPLTDRTTQAKEDRVRRLYRRQLDGLSARALVYDHKEKEQISINTAWRDWAEVKKLVDEDWQADRDNMLARLQHMRTKLFHQALKKGQLQTASQVLDSIGRVIGESVETVNLQAPALKLSIENKDD